MRRFAFPILVVALSAPALGQTSPSQGALAPVAPSWREVALADGGTLRYLPPHVTYADYPGRALREGVEGRTVVLLEVSPAGEILHCETAESSGYAELDAKACQIYFERGLFELSNVTEIVRLRAPVRWELQD